MQHSAVGADRRQLAVLRVQLQLFGRQQPKRERVVHGRRRRFGRGQPRARLHVQRHLEQGLIPTQRRELRRETFLAGIELAVREDYYLDLILGDRGRRRRGGLREGGSTASRRDQCGSQRGNV